MGKVKRAQRYRAQFGRVFESWRQVGAASGSHFPRPVAQPKRKPGPLFLFACLSAHILIKLACTLYIGRQAADAAWSICAAKIR